MKKFSIVLLGLLSSCYIGTGWSHWYEAQVQSVIDGDTIRVQRTNRHVEKLRLMSIDAPEHGQPYGRQSQQALANFIEGKLVKVEPKRRDQYERMLAKVYKNDIDVNHWMVEQGHAWVYTKDNVEPYLERAQQTARERQAGLWRSKSQVPPWQWRNQQRRQ